MKLFLKELVFLINGLERLIVTFYPLAFILNAGPTPILIVFDYFLSELLLFEITIVGPGLSFKLYFFCYWWTIPVPGRL